MSAKSRFLLSMALLAASVLFPAAGRSQVWETVGSALTVGQGDLARFWFINNTQFQHYTGITGTITARANINNPMDTGIGSPGWDVIEVRYKDDDGTGTNCQVKVVLYQYSDAGVLTAIPGATFDSNTFTSTTGVIHHLTFALPAYDFVNNAYFVVCTVSRSSTMYTPYVSLVRLLPSAIYNTYGGNDIMPPSDDGELGSARSEEEPGPAELSFSAPAAAVPVMPSGIQSVEPNPSNAGAMIRYALASGGQVSLDVYDVAGRLVRSLLSANQTAGNYSARWDGLDQRGVSCPNGLYLVRFTGPGGLSQNRKLVLSK